MGIIAQRLVRRLCPKCRRQKHATSEEKRALRIPENEDCLIYEPVGCRECSKGYKGRIGVYEIMPISHKIAGMISRGCNADEIEQQAINEGMTTLRRGAAEYVLSGITTISEMRKVAYDEESL